MTNKKAFKNSLQSYCRRCNSPVRAFANVQSEPRFISHGKGAHIFDIEGNSYIDYVQSWGPLLFGHCDKDILKACNEALKKGSSFGAPTLLETQLAELVLEDFPHLDKNSLCKQ